MHYISGKEGPTQLLDISYSNLSQTVRLALQLLDKSETKG